jgi:xylan 1,4-beta-xylosidase
MTAHGLHRNLRFVLACSVFPFTGLLGPWAASGAEPEAVRPIATFCNPLPIPDYPVGRAARAVKKGEPDASWKLGYREQFRELADVTVLWFEGKYFLYPSVDMAWVSADQGASWQHHPLNTRDIGYAPTVVRHRGRFLLLASGSPLYASDSPLGPFEKLGSIQLAHTGKMSAFIDPMLFSDDDGRLYYYWGCSPAGGIWGVELDAQDPTKVVTQPAELIPFQPAAHPWEAVGEWNQNPNRGWIEGCWLLKRNGRYYMTYSAAGTENRTYAMGCYTGASPLGPFTPQKRNPILRTPDGLVTGTAHGCIIAGPEDRLWAFYTIRAGVVHPFERRLGMDRAEIDANGKLFVPGATSLPQWLPGKGAVGESPHPGWLPLNGELQTLGSTNAPNLTGRLAVDNDLRTWWQPAEGDAQPTLTSAFMDPATIHAVRLLWRDVGLDTTRGVMPGPFRYRVDLETNKDTWTTVLDRRESAEDLIVDYRECKPTIGTRARLVILGWPKGMTPGVAEFTVFGKTVVTK